MRKAIKKILPLLFLLQLIYSCIADKDEFMDQIQNSNPVQIELSTRSFVEGGVTISKFRFIAVSAFGRVVINQMIDNQADKNFTFSSLHHGVFPMTPLVIDLETVSYITFRLEFP